MSSINFPEGFKGIKGYPGYFWDTVTEKLYSIKIGGVLRPLKLRKPFYSKYMAIYDPYYGVSKNGNSKILTIHMILKRLEDPHWVPRIDHEIL